MAKVHLIGNAHLDPVWLWRWQEGFAEILATYRSALDRMKEFDDFKFTSACAVYYQWIEKMDPEMFEEIRQRVKEGRWNIVGGWFLQPDCNIPSGESFARHALISQRYFKEKFGITVKTGYNVDSFGHNAGLPKILKASDIEQYVFMRPFPEEQGRGESLFWWESDDESRVLAYRIPWSYAISAVNLHLVDKIKQKAEAENTDLMAFYGVGNHGGGPTIKLLDTLHNMVIKDLVFSTPDEYFDSVCRENLPTIRDELQHHARGCYSTAASVKASNRRCEQNLLAAEKLCSMAKHLTGFSYPKKKLRKAWKNLLFNQFHDIMGGCSIKPAYEDASYLYGEIMSITEQAIFAAMQSISWKIDTLQGQTLPGFKEVSSGKFWEHEVIGMPIVVFNPHAWTVKMPVEICAVGTRVTDAEGNEIPFQKVRAPQTNGGDLYNLIFSAEVPAMGYAVYRVFIRKECRTKFEKILHVSERLLENDKIRVELDAVTGDISTMYDKEQEKYIIEKPCRAVILDETDCDTWAHNEVCLGETVGMFTAPQFHVIEEGDVRATLRVITRCNDSVLQRDYTIYSGSSNVQVKVKVDFHEKHRALKFTFPMKDTVTVQIPYGTINREGHTGEEPCGKWFASGNLCIANDSKYGYDTEDGEVRLSVLRSAIYADHYGHRDDQCEFMEQGVHEFTYSVFPYLSKSDSERKAEELNCGLRAVNETYHAGRLPEKMSCFNCDSENIFVSAVKEAEEEESTILRIYEMEGVDTKASIRLFENEIQAEVSHNALQTVDENGKTLNLMEW